MHQTQFSEKTPYGGFSQIQSHFIAKFNGLFSNSVTISTVTVIIFFTCMNCHCSCIELVILNCGEQGPNLR